MSQRDVIVRAWRDPEYRASMSEAERSLVPDHPAGAIELSDADLTNSAGGTDTCWMCWVTLSIAFSAWSECKDSLLHGTCSGWSIGCCS